jgi:aspartyl/asparaginyl beta-hydroxylase
MTFTSGLRHLGPVDVAVLSTLVERLSEAAWTQQMFRQETYSVHSRTRSIIFRFPTGGGRDHEEYLAWQLWKDMVLPVILEATKPYGYARGDFSSAMLASLPAHSSIDGHTDEGLHFARTHRVHVPLRTHPDVVMRIDGVPHHLALGHAYEVDNRLPHSVENPSAIDRVHLIFDYFDATVEDGLSEGH